MLKKRNALLLILAMSMILSLLVTFAENNESEEGIQWIEEPTLEEVKNKKVGVQGRLEIPERYNGPNKIKLSVGGFNVVPDHDGSFAVEVFKGMETEIEIKVFIGKTEIPELERRIYYLEDFTNVDNVLAMIEALPELQDLNIEDRDALIEVRLAYDNLSDIEKTFIRNLEKLIQLEGKMEYLENEKPSDILFTQVVPSPYDLYGNSIVRFEGYFYNAKYMDKVLIEDIDGNLEAVEADIEYIKDFEIGGRLYPAYKYTADVELEDGYYVMRVIGISQSGKQNNTAARFSVDTRAPELDIEILGVDENNTTTEEAVDVNIIMRDNFANLTLYVWNSYEFGQSYPTSDRRFREPAEYTTTTTLNLEMGENEFPIKLVDAAGNETIETVTIVREPVVTGRAQIQLWKDSGRDRVDFNLINDSFYIKNIATGEEFREGSIPWNLANGYRMNDIPAGEYTIHFDLAEGLYVEDIELGGAYNYTIYDPVENPLIIDDLGSNFNNARINIRSNTLLKEIRELNITLPNDMTYEEYLEVRPTSVIVVDENDVEYEVEARFTPNRVQYESGRERGSLRVQSQSTITLPLYVSNTIPPIRSYAYLNITFEEPVPEPILKAVHYVESSSPYVHKNMVEVDVQNIEGATRYHIKYQNEDGMYVVTNTARLGEPVQVGYSKRSQEDLPVLEDLEIVIKNDSNDSRINTLHIFKNVNPERID